MAKSNDSRVRVTGTIIFDKTVDFDGKAIRVVIDANRFPTVVDRYRTALLLSRNIPSQPIQQVDPTSEYAQAVISAMPNLASNMSRVTEMVESFYEQQRQEAQYDASLLALIADPSNVFEEEPTPYDDDDLDDLPGLVTFKKPVRDLTNPTERRLKQLYDFISKTPERMNAFMALVNECWSALALAAQQVRDSAGGFRIR